MPKIEHGDNNIKLTPVSLDLHSSPPGDAMYSSQEGIMGAKML